LELLWAFTGKKSPRGDVGKWPDGAIARACYWMGSPEAFISALRESGFIDADDTHRLIVHDWTDHAPRWVKAKLKSMGADFVTATTDPVVPTAVETVVPTVGAPSKGREEKRSQEQETREQARAVLGLDSETWDRWLEYRIGLKKPIKPISMVAAAKELAGYGPLQAAVVQHSVANGYQGLVPPKTNGKGMAPPAPKVPPTPDQITQAQREAAEANRRQLAKALGPGALKGMP
jgi:hypothetical protein